MPNSTGSNISAVAPSLVPPRTSSHGVAFPASSPPKSATSHIHQRRRSSPVPGSADPPQRKSSKRPVSTALESQSSPVKEGKKAVKGRLPGAIRPGLSQRHRVSVDYTEWVKQPARSPLMTMTEKKSPKQPPESIGDDFIHSKQRSWPPDKETILLGPYDYLFSQPGKDIRQQLISAFNEWLRVPEEKLTIITKVVGMLHTSSLLIDDVEDSSQLRRGEPVAHSIFGIPQVINSANYVYFLALQELSRLNNAECIQIFTEELLNLHRGQGMDLYWRDTLSCPSEDDYLEMVSNKTGGLFRLAIKLMQAESTTIKDDRVARTSTIGNAMTGALAAMNLKTGITNGESSTNSDSDITCVPLINTIGILFQILDDLLNLTSTAYHSRKGHAEDLTEGKFSYPVIHAVRANPSNLVLINVLRQRTTDGEVKRYAVEYMERTGSFDYTKSVIAQLEKKAVREVSWLEERIGGDAGRKGGELIRGILGKLKAL